MESLKVQLLGFSFSIIMEHPNTFMLMMTSSNLPVHDNPYTLAIAIKTMDAFVNEMGIWLAIHMLLCNDKTDLMLFGSHYKEPFDFPELSSNVRLPETLALWFTQSWHSLLILVR